MKKFNHTDLYYLVLYTDEELTNPEISTLTYLNEFTDPDNKTIYQFKSLEDNDPPKTYRFHEGAESVYTFEEMVKELNEITKRGTNVGYKNN